MTTRPLRSLALREAPRAALEYGSFRRARSRLLDAPRGDGAPVLVLPGFTGSDVSTRALRRLLRELGYHVHAWRLGRNWGPTDHIVDGLGERVRDLVERHAGPLNLVGHSLGGIYAREVARAAPEAVRQVITLGSPVRRPQGAAGPAAPLFRALSPLHSDRARQVDETRIAHALRVPLTAIFTRSDGVVPWEVCLAEPGPLAQNIEVRGSHSGLIHNVAAVAVVADRLGCDPWGPYHERPAIAARIWEP